MIVNRHAGGYRLILADCPWDFVTYSNPRQDRAAPYDVQHISDLWNMPVEGLAAKNSMLLTWATAPMLRHAVDTVAAWGFDLKTAAAWAKQSSTGKSWAFGTGYI